MSKKVRRPKMIKQVLVKNSGDCVFKNNSRDNNKCHLTKSSCGYDGFPPDCPLLDDTVSVIRKKAGSEAQNENS